MNKKVVIDYQVIVKVKNEKSLKWNLIVKSEMLVACCEKWVIKAVT